MGLKSFYVVQPYEVGNKNSKKSLAIILPAKITKLLNIDASTAFEVRCDERVKNITMWVLNTANTAKENNKTTVPVGQGFQALNQQVQSGSQ